MSLKKKTCVNCGVQTKIYEQADAAEECEVPCQNGQACYRSSLSETKTALYIIQSLVFFRGLVTRVCSFEFIHSNLHGKVSFFMILGKIFGSRPIIRNQEKESCIVFTIKSNQDLCTFARLLFKFGGFCTNFELRYYSQQILDSLSDYRSFTSEYVMKILTTLMRR